MKRLILCIVFLLLAPINAWAKEPEVSARAAICVDAESFGVIYEKNADEKLPMASTTKIITAITAIENGDLDSTVTVSEHASLTEGSSVYLAKGERLSLRELLYALMLESGNDAAVAIAEHISGSEEEFAKLMNETCRKAGANNTSCVTVNGLDAQDHYTTARDLALLTRYAMRSEVFREIASSEKQTIPWQGKEWDRTLENHNKLLKTYPGANGVKTGYTKKSGRCLVSSASRGALSTIVVTLNAPDDWNDHKKLLDYSFESFSSLAHTVKKSELLGTVCVEGFNEGCISYKAADDCFLRQTDEPLDVKLSYNIENTLHAPIKSGEIIGSVDIYNKGMYVKSVNLLSCDNAEVNDKAYIIKSSCIKLLRLLLFLVR